MVGGEGGSGGPAAGLTAAGGPAGAGATAAAGSAADVRAAYSGGADAWAGGPEHAYAALARALLATAAAPLAGRRVLDLGAGTGVLGRAALAAGAGHVVAADFALGMLRFAARPLRPVAADAVALPFCDGSFDVVVSAFCLSHLASLAAGLAEVRRVGRALAASAFAPGWSHPAQNAVDEVLGSFGYRPPAWYLRLKSGTAPAASDPELLAGHAARAGFRDVQLRTVAVHTGLTSPAQLASWRLGMAPVVPFLRSLDPPGRAALRQAAERAVAGTGPLVVAMLVLTAS
jgi:SAM-dependent methyltransferase